MDFRSKDVLSYLTLKNLALVGLVFIFLFLYYPVILKLIESWEVDQNYSHGFFIPFISLYLIYTKKEQLKNISPTPSNMGLLVTIMGLGLFILSWIASLDLVQGISMLIVIFGSVLFLFGVEVSRIVLFPICYLIFMIPLPAIIWNKLSLPLSLFASSISTHIMKMLGLVVLREGNVITLPNITLQVVEACSGLRSLITLMALSAALAYISNLTRGRKIVLFFCAIPIAVVGNVIRLTITGILSENFGKQMAEGFIHEFSGWLVFIAGFLLLLLIQRLLERA